MNLKQWMAAASLAPVLAACGGDGDPPPAPVVRLCPQTIDYNTVFIGGSGSGELVKVQLDTTKMTYRMTYLASPVPATTGTVQPTRDTAPANVVDGTLADETGLPTVKLNQCTFRMQNASLDPSRPARLFLGEGVLGGAIPGATIQFDGVIGVGKITKTTFPYYPFISFSSLETDLTKIAGTYNQLGYHQVPSQNFQPVALDQQVTINADGSYTETDNFGKKNGGQPLASSATVNQPFTLRPDAPAFQSLNYLPQIPPTLAALDPAKAGKGILIVGKLRNQLVPVFIRTGAANADLTQGPPSADDESGISFLSPRTAVAQGSQDGEYTGVDSAFNYRATALVGAQATLLDPFNASQAALTRALNLDYTQKVPGVVTTVHADAASGPATGKFVFTGGVFGFLDMADTSNPYFTVGAFVQ
ncbi:DUF2957 domain-containing protein [Burkholderia cenocepacia]|uniref:DUF2957 domain-containing protein n=2 Tax=Burkholderia cepacia complex TaxID=87882 RepID=A0AAW4TG80_9BURK|nr:MULTISPECIES: DUF2957 domain-containing protein [Burkholderia cepacia complex]ACA94306.1 conserved hypothetical protein [Burkholderia orbicola MC0-3]AOJ19644.1 hypothetical protein WJ11_09795 [Burkholderia cenocepacia]AQQ34220.1 hypothetical protein A8E96_18395 [Burkholderia cenocepacia]AQT53461.1 hypothetical protein BHQ31_26040 [Burkholderia cenocepacia]ELW9451460.1 DUF2957 domain-containing protein [Burkholderia cenocepacia]